MTVPLQWPKCLNLDSHPMLQPQTNCDALKMCIKGSERETWKNNSELKIFSLCNCLSGSTVLSEIKCFCIMSKWQHFSFFMWLYVVCAHVFLLLVCQQVNIVWGFGLIFNSWEGWWYQWKHLSLPIPMSSIWTIWTLPFFFFAAPGV